MGYGDNAMEVELIQKKQYQRFLASKAVAGTSCGINIDASAVNPMLKPHQRDAVVWAVNGGRRALFEAFGLGKTVQQLEILRIITERENCNGLIVCPLGVRQEFKRDAAMMGVSIRFVRSNDDMDALPLLPEIDSRIYLTNYESIREKKLDPSRFKVISLDEAAILRGFGGTKTFRALMQMFEGSATYRFVATATPSPNEYIELLSYAAFLGVMDVGQGKTRFFKRDSTNADRLTLHPHKQKEFWLWCSSWALFLQKPSDLGYPDDGYTLPEIDVRWHELPTDHARAGTERNGQGRLIQETTISVQNVAREKRESLDARLGKLLELRTEDQSAHRIIWHDLEREREAIEQAIPGCVTVYGSLDLDEREKLIMDFSNGSIPELAGKPSMLGSGTNFQYYCSWAIYLGIGFKFAEFIQSVHRLQRYLQPNKVRIALIYTEAEREVRRTIERKWAQHAELV